MDVTAPEGVGLSGERLRRIDGWMRHWVDGGRLPGLSVTVLRRGRVALWVMGQNHRAHQ